MTTANTAAAITAPYADGQTWTRNDADGETVQLLDEIDASDADIVAYSEPDADWKVATFADGSMVLLTESWWAVLVADGMDGNGDRRWTELNPAAVVTNDDIAAAVQTLTAAVEAAAAEFDGINWDNHMDAIADVLESAKPSRLRKLVGDANEGDLETGSEYPDDGTHDSQSHRREIAECIESLKALDLDDDAAVTELARRFRALADDEAAYVTSRSDAAADLGREAVDAANEGDYEGALRMAEEARGIEMEFGDDSAWRPVVTAAEALVELAAADDEE